MRGARYLTSTERLEGPTTSRTILGRMQEVTFNSTVMRGIQVIAFVTDLIEQSKIAEGKRMPFHTINGELRAN